MEIMAREYESMTAVTHLLITKYTLKLAGICGFCNVSSSLLTGIPSSHLHILIIPDDVSIKFDLLMMST